MKRIFVLAGKDFHDVVRERSILLAFLVQLFVAAFSTFLTVGLVGLYDPESVQGFPQTTIAYTGPGGLEPYLQQSGNLIVLDLPPEAAIAQFQAGDLAAVIEETYANESAARVVSLLLPEGEIRTTLLVTQIKNVLRDYERDLRLERDTRIQQSLVYVETDAQANPFFGFAYGVLLPLLIITPVFLAGATAGDSFSQEIATRTLHLLRASPLSSAEIVIGKILTPVVLVPFQVLLWILLLRFNGLAIQNLHLLLVLSLALGILLAAGSLLIALLVRREGQTQAAYTILVLVLFVAGILLPRDPFNVIARLAVGNVDFPTILTLGLYAVAAIVMLGLALTVANRRVHTDPT